MKTIYAIFDRLNNDKVVYIGITDNFEFVKEHNFRGDDFHFNSKLEDGSKRFVLREVDLSNDFDFNNVKNFYLDQLSKLHGEENTMSKSFYKNNGSLKVYSANPWFNEEQYERSEFIKNSLTSMGFDVFDPKSSNLVEPDSSESWREQAFSNNLRAIRDCDFILAVTDGKDMGVCFEVGYAHALGIPVVYYAETLGNNKFNLMLAQSGIHIITSREQLLSDLRNEDLLKSIKSRDIHYSKYQGNIE